QTGLPNLYTPAVAGTLGGPIRFTARLSSTIPWTVTVVDSLGVVVGTGAGVGPTVDWTWNSTLAAPGAAYTWAISAGATVRGALGVLGGKVAALTLTDVQVSPPTLDGNAIPSATVSYTLSSPA